MNEVSVEVAWETLGSAAPPFRITKNVRITPGSVKASNVMALAWDKARLREELVQFELEAELKA